MIMTCKKHKKKRLFVIFFNNGFTLLTTKKWRHKRKGLKPRVQHQRKHIMGFVFFIFFKEGNKRIQNPNNFFLMLEAKHDNSKTTFTSSSIKLLKVVESISSLNFRLINMAKFNASHKNQWPLDWFRIQANTIGPRESTII